MDLESPSFTHRSSIPDRFAFARPDPEATVALSANVSPALRWSGVPDGTRSFVLLCHDPDVPSRPDDVNVAGRRVPYDLPRIDFFHWVLMDIPGEARSLDEGEGSIGIMAGGKPGPATARGHRHGLNDYTSWFANDPAMTGSYFGYDGPCPPWNDTRVHHYWFTLYALDVATCPVEGVVDGRAVRAAIAPHVLATATLMGTYTIASDAT